MSKDRWIKALRDQLPDSGAATLIVTDENGARYLSISSSDIDNFVNKSAVSKRITHFALLLMLLVLCSATGFSAYTEKSLSLEINTLQAGLNAYSDILSNVDVTLPASVSNHANLSSPVLAERIHALTDIIHIQHESFSYFVDATQPVVASAYNEIVENLVAAGLQWQSGEPGGTSMPIGGAEQTDYASTYLAYHLDNAIDAHADLINIRDYVGALPVQHPLEHGRITSRYGVRRHPITRSIEPHRGIDFVSYSHPDVKATAQGIVIFAGRDGFFGNKVILRHAGEVTTVYAHLDTISVKVGDLIEAGDVIGVMGNTGRSTAAHLHYEVHVNGNQVDPLKFMGLEQHVH